jgi:hypothetical protein
LWPYSGGRNHRKRGGLIRFIPRILIGFLTILFAPSLFGQSGYFEFGPSIQKAYQSILELRLDAAGQEIAEAKQLQPSNLAPDLLENYLEVCKLYLHDDKELFKKWARNENSRANHIMDHGAKEEPYRLYSLAEIHLQWAVLYLKYGQYLAGFNRIKKAHQYLLSNVKKFPAFVPNQKSLGLIHALLSTVPAEYKWIMKALAGLQGDMGLARFEMEQVILYSDKSFFLFRDETLVMYALLVANLDNDMASAWNIISKTKLTPEKSPLYAYILAHLAQKSYQNEQALRYLMIRPIGKQYYTSWFFEYTLGLCKLRKLDPDADLHLTKFVNHYKGSFFIKECYQKLAWFELLKNNPEGYHRYLQQARNLGTQILEEDQQAYREAVSGKVVNVDLVKARLLFDGGYFERSKRTIEALPFLQQPSSAEYVEAHYRLGRALHLLHQPGQAIPHYLTAADKGKILSSYFACAAYLYAGQCYETLYKKGEARQYYEKCIATKPKEYAAGLHQKAKAGLLRLQ